MQTKAFNNSILDIFGFTGYNPSEDAIVVAFRSTVSLQNWIVNLDATQVTFHSCRCPIQDALDVRCIKAFIMHSLVWRDTSVLKFKS